MKNDNKDKNEYIDNRFERPNLPIKQFILSIVIPVFVAMIPYILSKNEASLEICIIIGLIVMVILLFCLAFSLMLRIYDSEYSRQLIKIETNSLNIKVDKIFKNDELLNNQVKDINNKIKSFELSIENDYENNINR